MPFGGTNIQSITPTIQNNAYVQGLAVGRASSHKSPHLHFRVVINQLTIFIFLVLQMKKLS